MLTKSLKSVLEKLDECEVRNFLLNFKDEQYEELDLSKNQGKDDFIAYKEKNKERKVRKKVGKFINKHTKKFTARDIEVFVNKFKAVGKFQKLKDKFKLVDGKDIIWGYSSTNYSIRSGSLGSSCMNNRSKNQYNLYVHNPDKIKLLALVDNNNKILARALVWKGLIREGKNPEERNNSEAKKAIVIDRVYCSDEYQQDLFKQYASINGWLYKSGQMSFIRPDGKLITGRFKSKLKKYKFSDKPYIDTMRYLSKKGSISNKVWAYKKS